MGLAALRHVGSSQTRARTRVPCMAGRFLTTVPPGKPPDLTFYLLPTSLLESYSPLKTRTNSTYFLIFSSCTILQSSFFRAPRFVQGVSLTPSFIVICIHVCFPYWIVSFMRANMGTYSCILLSLPTVSHVKICFCGKEVASPRRWGLTCCEDPEGQKRC